MEKTLGAISRMMNTSIVNKQIDVYLDWARIHHRWYLLGEERWLTLFVKINKLENVHDITQESMDTFRAYLRKEYNGQIQTNSAVKAVVRFIRYYSARTKSFTDNPRYVVMGDKASLSTEMVR